jgi:hypothetical protein|eukprot:COSAG02_NODE_7128_length_3168_cov_3.176279_3_plen_87_part_00
MGNPFVAESDDGSPMNLDPKNLWCIHGKRYDLRMHDFLDRHPGERPAPPSLSLPRHRREHARTPLVRVVWCCAGTSASCAAWCAAP